MPRTLDMGDLSIKVLGDVFTCGDEILIEWWSFLEVRLSVTHAWIKCKSISLYMHAKY